MLSKLKVEFYKFHLVIVNLGIRQILAISLKPAVRQIVSRTFLEFAEEAACAELQKNNGSHSVNRITEPFKQ